jgi:lipopolysaccharide transport system permease protein
VTLFASALNVALRDVGQVLPLAIQLWMYATPIVYPVALVPERFRTVYMLNPMAGIIDAYRQVILVGQWPDFVHLGLAALVSLLVFAGAYRYFKTAELQFADII